MIALQINNQNEARRIKKIEIEYLTNLKKEYQNNADALQQIIQIRMKIIDNIDQLLTISDYNKIDDKEWQIFIFTIHNYGNYVFSAKSPILDEIINSGDMVNIANPKLRTLLTLWEQQMDGVFGTQQEIKKYRDKITDILIEYGELSTELSTGYYGYIDYSSSRKSVEQLSIWKNNLILLRDEFLYLQNDIYPITKAYFEEVVSLIEQ